MPDANMTVPGELASKALAYLIEISPEMRGCAILDSDGRVLAASGSPRAWEDAAHELGQAADAAGGEPVSHVHVSTGDGDVFLVRAENLAAVAVTERLTLASLVLFDLRSALHGVAAGEGGR
jgi:predicted regulator of Ras-like GTPase activity (Roadblock/LC7/MglB family)